MHVNTLIREEVFWIGERERDQRQRGKLNLLLVQDAGSGVELTRSHRLMCVRWHISNSYLQIIYGGWLGILDWYRFFILSDAYRGRGGVQVQQPQHYVYFFYFFVIHLIETLKVIFVKRWILESVWSGTWSLVLNWIKTSLVFTNLCAVIFISIVKTVNFFVL